MPSIGVPIVSLLPGSKCLHSAVTVASVGPYILIRRTRPAQRSINPVGQASPPKPMACKAGNARSGRVASKAVGQIIWLLALRSSCSSSPSSGSPQTRLAPWVSGSSAHILPASKDSDMQLNMRASQPSCRRCAWSCSKLTKPPCSTITPLGRPLEPEV
ncbi:hypothetical protein D3C84_853560 [compost metagenome]